MVLRSRTKAFTRRGFLAGMVLLLVQSATVSAEPVAFRIGTRSFAVPKEYLTEYYAVRTNDSYFVAGIAARSLAPLRDTRYPYRILFQVHSGKPASAEKLLGWIGRYRTFELVPVDNVLSELLPRHANAVAKRHGQFFGRIGSDTFLVNCFGEFCSYDFDFNDLLVRMRFGSAQLDDLYAIHGEVRRLLTEWSAGR